MAVGGEEDGNGRQVWVGGKARVRQVIHWRQGSWRGRSGDKFECKVQTTLPIKAPTRIMILIQTKFWCNNKKY